MVTTKGLPMNYFEDPHVQRTYYCISEGNQTLHFLSASTMKRRILASLSEVRTKVLTRIPPPPQRISIGMDCWSDPSRYGFIAIKAFWISTGV
jgi:hypothetical protein